MDEIVENLPILQRLALSYAPGRARPATLALFALDERLAGIVRRSSEPMLAQIKLAWWRDLLGVSPENWPKGEPLLGILAEWGPDASGLTELVDAWENLVGGELIGVNHVRLMAKARGEAFSCLAKALGHTDSSDAARHMGSSWAMSDLATALPTPEERELARSELGNLDWSRRALPRDLRPLTVLHGLAARCARRGEGIGNSGAGLMLPAMRIGLLGL